MAWVALNNEERKRVRLQLPDVDSLQKKVVYELQPDVIAIWYMHNTDSTLPIAAVCLRDATDVLMQVKHALSEMLSFRIWYLERQDPPNKGAADYMAQFYSDDIALRLYAVLEHLNNAIHAMLEVDKNSLKGYGKRGIGKNTLAYLNDEHSGTKIASLWSRLLSSPDWNAVRKYRNNWVHNKPPIVKKSGDQFNREIRWKEIGTGVRQLTIKEGGDKSDLNIEELMQMAKNAFLLIFRATDDIVDLYLTMIEPSRKQSFLSTRIVDQDHLESENERL